jgi:hypothetical protein
MPKDGKIRGFLPPYYRPEVGPTVTRPGVWDDKGDEAFLEMLIHAMPPGTDLMLADLVSLPHVWGQTLAFTVAWRDVSHPMHLTVRGEWRGLLALIGLAGWEEWPVNVVEVNLTKLAERPFKTSSGPTSDDPAGEPRPNFPKVVLNNLPDNAAIGAPLWKNSAVVLYDRNSVSRPERSSDARPIAFCAPRSLLVPARNYAHVLDGRIPWQADRKGGYPLRDPLDCDGNNTLSRIQLEVLWNYLEKVRSRVISEAGKRAESDSPHVGFLISMLNKYMRDIEQKRETQSVKAPATSELISRWDDERFRGFGSPYFDVLNSIPGRPIQRVPMETRIDAPKGIASGDFKGLVLYGRDLVRDPGLTPRDVLVWGAFTLEDLGEESLHFTPAFDNPQPPAPGRRGTLKAQEKSRERVKMEAQTQGYLVLHVDELFYPEILRMTKVPEGHDQHWDGWLPPLRPVALTIFSADDLRRSLSIEDVGDEVRVTLRLEDLGDRVGVGLRNRLEKTYRKGRSPVAPPAVLAVWPDFDSPEWHHYGVFHLRDGEKEMDAHPLPSTEDWLPAFVACWRNGDSLVDFFDHLPNDTRFMDAGDGKDEEPQCRGRWFHRRPNVLVGTSNASVPRCQGLMLLPPAQNAEATGRGAIVGLDIGSTNTSAAWFLPGENHRQDGERQVVLDPLLTFLFEPTASHRCRMEETFGFPAKEKKLTPFLSLLKERKKGRGRKPGLPAIHYRIPWPLLETLDLNSIAKDREAGETYICDLKWAQRNEATELFFESIEQYLTLLMRLIGAGIVKRGLTLRTTEWRFSYPDTFTTAEVNSFREIIDRLIRQLNQPERVTPRNAAPPPTSVVARKECDSVCGYFMKRYGSVAQSNTVIVFDVGGRNTDVAIWHQNKIAWNGTLALANRDTMVDFLMRNNGLLNPIFPEIWDDYRALVLESERTDSAFARMLTELLVQDNRFHEWQVRAREPHRDSGKVARLRDMATFALAGLLYYTALAYVETLSVGGNLPDRNSPAMSVQICFGGTGSLLFRNFVDRSLDQKLIKWFYRAISDFEKRKIRSLGGEILGDGGTVDGQGIYPPIIFNDRGKREVSEGLLLDPISDSVHRTYEPSPTSAQNGPIESIERKPLYLGEAVYRPGDRSNPDKNFYEYLTSADLKDSGTWELHGLELFENFVTIFQEEFQIPLGTGTAMADAKSFAREILGTTKKEFDVECEMALKDYQRYHRNGDGRTYQPQPVFILALRVALSHYNKQSSSS